jgi:hypothetical protein
MNRDLSLAYTRRTLLWFTCSPERPSKTCSGGYPKCGFNIRSRTHPDCLTSSFRTPILLGIAGENGPRTLDDNDLRESRGGQSCSAAGQLGLLTRELRRRVLIGWGTRL